MDALINKSIQFHQELDARQHLLMHHPKKRELALQTMELVA